MHLDTRTHTQFKITKVLKLQIGLSKNITEQVQQLSGHHRNNRQLFKSKLMQIITNTGSGTPGRKDFKK